MKKGVNNVPKIIKIVEAQNWQIFREREEANRIKEKQIKKFRDEIDLSLTQNGEFHRNEPVVRPEEPYIREFGSLSKPRKSTSSGGRRRKTKRNGKRRHKRNTTSKKRKN